MTSLDAIEAKISSVKKYLSILRGYQGYARETVERDLTLKAAVERYLYLVTQAAIDLGEAIISFKNFRRPGTYSETFDILNEEGFLPSALSQKLVKMAGFRNIIAHEYEDVDFKIVYEVLKHRLEDIESFLSEVENKLTRT